jgi:cardiolipin synthase
MRTYAKTLADMLTTIRFLIALWIAWLGVTGGQDALPTATIALILAWATDVLDGPLARRDPSQRETWIGNHDLHVDMAVACGVLVYLTAAGFLPLPVSLGYLLLSGILLWFFRSVHLAWGLQVPPYGKMLLVALQEVPIYGVLALGWIGLTVSATWPRFHRETVPQFLDGMRDLWHILKQRY